MSEEIRKKIEEKATEYSSDPWMSIGFRTGAEFGYQLGYEQGGRDAVEYFMKTIYEDTLRRYSVPMASESKEPKP